MSHRMVDTNLQVCYKLSLIEIAILKKTLTFVLKYLIPLQSTHTTYKSGWSILLQRRRPAVVYIFLTD